MPAAYGAVQLTPVPVATRIEPVVPIFPETSLSPELRIISLLTVNFPEKYPLPSTQSLSDGVDVPIPTLPLANEVLPEPPIPTDKLVLILKLRLAKV
jgi:hypothetical protein